MTITMPKLAIPIPIQGAHGDGITIEDRMFK